MNLKTKGIYSDGMVLQRETVNCIFGTAKPEKTVTLTFRNQTITADSDKEGNWKIEYNPGSAGGPFQMEITSDSENLTFKDVYVGEVWISSGQSNAQLQMERLKFSYPEDYTAAPNQNIRMITIPITWSFDGEKDSVENPTWVCASPETIGGMAGTGYFFAKKLTAELGIPVGIINNAQGGSPISSWMSKKSLQELNQNEYLSRLAYYENPENVTNKQKDLAESQKNWDTLLNNSDAGAKENWEQLPFSKIDDSWTDCEVPGYIEDFDSAGFVWIKKEVILTDTQVKHFDAKKTWIWLGTIIDADKVWINGTLVGGTGYSYPPRRYVVPAGTLKEGSNTITVRLQKNSKYGKIRFYEEKPYFLFTENAKIHPVVVRNVEIPETKTIPSDAECIGLSGKWKKKIGTKVEDAPAGMFFEWCPTALYNSMLSPCFNYAIKGALWYQGESDAGRYAEYTALLKKMIQLWREKFVYAPKNMPFVVMQLPNWSDGHGEDTAVVFSDWACQRESQAKAVKETENAALAVTIDAGEWNDLHPEKKLTGGTRAACQAMRLAYSKNYKPAPEFKNITKVDAGYEVEIETFGSVLKACAVNGKSADLNAKEVQNKVCGFSVLYTKTDGKEDCVEVPAQLISETKVLVKLPELPGQCKALRYLWAQSPAPVNLYSAELLPAAPFSVDLK